MNRPAVLTLCCFSLPQMLWAQMVETSAVASEAPTAQVRAWIFNSEEPCRLSLRDEKSEEATIIAEVEKSGANIDADYRPVLAGRYRVDLFREDQVLASEVVILGKDSVQSLVAWPEGGKWRIKSFSDNAAPNATDKPLRLLHFNEQVGLVLVIDDGPEQIIPVGTVVERRVAPKQATLYLKVVGPEQELGASSYFEVDFSSWPSAYALAQTDYRGRIKPALIEGGVSVESQAAP